jgi:hypothetical protein
MNQRERDLLGRIYTCTLSISGGGHHDTRPAELERVREGAKFLAHAISNLGFGDLEEAAAELDAAEDRLAKSRFRGLPGTDA